MGIKIENVKTLGSDWDEQANNKTQVFQQPFVSKIRETFHHLQTLSQGWKSSDIPQFQFVNAGASKQGVASDVYQPRFPRLILQLLKIIIFCLNTFTRLLCLFAAKFWIVVIYVGYIQSLHWLDNRQIFYRQRNFLDKMSRYVFCNKCAETTSKTTAFPLLY